MSGISLHAGVSRGAGGWLHSPAVDARDLAAAAAARGFAVQRVLIDCTAGAFLDDLTSTCGRLRRGDTLLITFSGHGREKAWCFFDRDLPFADVLHGVPQSTYVCIVADACHSDSWLEVAVPARVQVMVVAPQECHPRDGGGGNTRSELTAALLRALHAGRPISFMALTPISRRFTPLTVVPAPPALRGGHAGCDRADRRRPS